MELLFNKIGRSSCTWDIELKIIYEKGIGIFCRIYVSMIIQISYSNHSTNQLLKKMEGKRKVGGIKKHLVLVNKNCW